MAEQVCKHKFTDNGHGHCLEEEAQVSINGVCDGQYTVFLNGKPALNHLFWYRDARRYAAGLCIENGLSKYTFTCGASSEVVKVQPVAEPQQASTEIKDK